MIKDTTLAMFTSQLDICSSEAIFVMMLKIAPQTALLLSYKENQTK